MGARRRSRAAPDARRYARATLRRAGGGAGRDLPRALATSCARGAPNRLVLMHGPNGSAKSTVGGLHAARARALLDARRGRALPLPLGLPDAEDGARLASASAAGARRAAADGDSYAHLDDDEIDARLVIELRDHPLFLIPLDERRALLERALRATGAASEPPPDWLLRGQLSHKNQQVFEALLVSYHGSLRRGAAARPGRALLHLAALPRRRGHDRAADARRRGRAADHRRSLALGAPDLAPGDHALRGLRRAGRGGGRRARVQRSAQAPARRLQLPAADARDRARCRSQQQTRPDQLRHDRERATRSTSTPSASTPSSRASAGASSCVRAPYLRSYVDEQRIYDAQIAPQLRAPRRAARDPAWPREFAVLTRMRQPEPKRYTPRRSRAIVASLTAVEKMDLYATGTPPERLDPDSQKVLARRRRGHLPRERRVPSTSRGGSGVSPREMRTLLLDAAQSAEHACLSPFAVLDELDELCKRNDRVRVAASEKPLAGGYHDHASSARSCAPRPAARHHRGGAARGERPRRRDAYAELFDRYIAHVGVWVKGEKIRNPHTGEYERPRRAHDARGRGAARRRRGKPEDHRRGHHLGHRRLGDRSPGREDRQRRWCSPQHDPEAAARPRSPIGAGSSRTSSAISRASSRTAQRRGRRPRRRAHEGQGDGPRRAAPGARLLRRLRARRGERAWCAGATPSSVSELSPRAAATADLLVDTHCHLDDALLPRGRRRRDRARERRRGRRVRGGRRRPDLELGRHAVALAARRPTSRAVVGMHPHDASVLDEPLLARLAQLCAEPRVAAVGEIGLDYHYLYSPAEQQQAVFRRMIRLARDLAKPIVVHTRSARPTRSRILDEEQAAEVGGSHPLLLGGLALRRPRPRARLRPLVLGDRHATRTPSPSTRWRAARPPTASWSRPTAPTSPPCLFAANPASLRTSCTRRGASPSSGA